jgi:hypothetical protein
MSILKMRSLAAALVLATSAAGAFASDVAIIVHPTNTHPELSMTDLSRLFRLDQPRWKSGDKVDLVLQVGVSAKQDVILGRVFHMKADEMQGFWLGKVFRGELSAPPRAFASDVSVKQYVAANPHAIGYIDAALVDNTVRAVRIDGRMPGESGYVLAREPSLAPASAASSPAASPRP